MKIYWNGTSKNIIGDKHTYDGTDSSRNDEKVSCLMHKMSDHRRNRSHSSKRQCHTCRHRQRESKSFLCIGTGSALNIAPRYQAFFSPM